MINLFNPKF